MRTGQVSAIHLNTKTLKAIEVELLECINNLPSLMHLQWAINCAGCYILGITCA